MSDPVDTEYDDEFGSLEGSPDAEIDQPVSDDGSVTESTPTEQAVDGTPRVLLDGKDERKSVTAYINPQVLYEIADLQTQLSREFTPEPRKLDVYAAVFYAGLPNSDLTMRDFLREFGYQED